MRKLIVILLCLPLFIFSQEENTYTRTMSITQFAKELKEAAGRGGGYSLENCLIQYKEDDSIYRGTKTNYFNTEEDILLIDEDVYFDKKSLVTFTNCRIRSHRKSRIDFILKNFHFGDLNISNTNLDLSEISANRITIKESSVNIDSSEINIVNTLGNWDEEEGEKDRISIEKSKITYCSVKDNFSVSLMKNTISYLSIQGKIKRCVIYQNIFNINPKNIFNIHQKNDNEFTLFINNGINIEKSDIQELRVTGNKIETLNDESNIDTLIKIIETAHNNPQKPEFVLSWGDTTYKFNMIRIHKIFQLKAKWGYLPILKDQLLLLKKYRKIKDSLKINYSNKIEIILSQANISKFYFEDNTCNFLSIENTDITESLYFTNNKIDLLEFRKNNLPNLNKIKIDSSIIDNLGFELDDQIFYGTEDYDIAKEYMHRKWYHFGITDLIVQYREFISILDKNGSDVKMHAVIKLKDIQTNKKMYEFHENPSVNAWFNWRGSEFLKWYSDYGTNPFKALTYCFWSMLYFALFYFFFYSDWDKIDRSFLIKRFNSVMDYFTTEKRIEDFYSSTHDKEMTTFTEFKNTLDKNKVHMPSMLASLAKPIYQLSLLRYRLLNFSYKKAEFMAGRKWMDLKKKDRYLIGTLTFFLTLTYIIYLIFIRALNSIALSVNSFSTLGFGQIPVRGFTKYVAIIEGFIGWFMLSVFIVSLLSQMMSV